MKALFSLIFFGFSLFSFAQEADTLIPKINELLEVRVTKDYNRKYIKALKRVQRVYPLALYAAKKLNELEEQLKDTDSKHKQKRISKAEQKKLKDEFTYVIRDLYTEEGKLLMKLIHRETGLTVSEIIKKYRGELKAEFNEALAKIWEQDLNSKYDPEGDDWIVEAVIQDVKNGLVEIDQEPKILSREAYKENMKAYRERKRENSKALKELKKSERNKKEALTK